MQPKKRKRQKVKSQLHPRNKHQGRYDLDQLAISCPALTPYVHLNKYGDQSIDFFDPAAVKLLNKALLMHYYDLVDWDIPENYLCPPIPGRADYLHHIAELLAGCNNGKTPNGPTIKCLDIGGGANFIYPIIGVKEYGWSFIGSEIDSVAFESAKKIMEWNQFLKEKIELRLQNNPDHIFQGIVQNDEYVDLTMCNPPFHASEQEAGFAALRKLKNLKHQKIEKPVLNFGGQNVELWCKGGEKKFVQNMITESKEFSHSCFWFSTLISKASNLKGVYEGLRKVEAEEVRTIPIGQGNKISRIVAWTFLDKEKQDAWIAGRW